MRTPLLALTLAIALSGCEARLPGFSETRITGTREGEAAGWTPAGAPAPLVAPAAPLPEAAPPLAPPPEGAVGAEAAAPVAAEPAPVAPAPTDTSPVADGATALLALKAYVDAYQAKDPAKVASFEAALLAARRKAESETESQFQWSIERGHAEVFIKGQDFRVITAALALITVDHAGGAITVRTKDGSPLLRATYSLDGEAGSHAIEKLVLVRGADGQFDVSALPFAEAAPAPEEATWPLPEGPLVTGVDREAALDVVAALNEAYARKDAAAVAALLPDALGEADRDNLAGDLAEALFSVRPLARELLTVIAVGDELEVVGPRAVIASFPFKRAGTLVQVKHGAIRLKKQDNQWVIARSCDTPDACR